MKKILTLFLIVFMTSAALAASRSGADRSYPWSMRSVAALGMGDAFYVKSDNKYAPFYNPAGLARIKNRKVDIFPLASSFNSDAFSFTQDVLDVDFDNDEEVADMLRDYITEPISAQFSLYPSYTKQNLTIGFYVNADVGATAANPVLPELNLDAEVEAGLVFGLANSVLDDRLQFGAAARVFYRVVEADSYSFMELSEDDFDLSYEDMGKGMNMMTDAGLIYNFYTDGINPRVGVAVNNIRIFAADDVRNPPTTLSISAGISPSFGGVNTDIILDIRDLTKEYDQDSDFGKRLNLGVEARFFSDKLALRTGLHQGYWTGGLGLNFRVFSLNYAYYREELGAYSGQNGDERHALEVVLGF